MTLFVPVSGFPPVLQVAVVQVMVLVGLAAVQC